MKVGIIVGSHRKKSQSGKVGAFIESVLQKRSTETYMLSLEENPIPLYTDDSEKRNEYFSEYAKNLQQCSSFVVITPEWHGMATAGLKNLLLHVTKNEVGFKPALLVGVSAGRGGAYPISELRASGYKNNRINYIPEHLIFREVESILNQEIPENKNDEYMRERTDYALDVLKEFDSAYKSMNQATLLNQYFGNGM